MTLPLIVGNAYVNDRAYVARKITGLANGLVQYADYGYPDGEPFSPRGECQRGTFRKWAARVLTPQEAAVLREEDMDEKQYYLRGPQVEDMLTIIPTELLHAELARRSKRGNRPAERTRAIDLGVAKSP